MEWSPFRQIAPALSAAIWSTSALAQSPTGFPAECHPAETQVLLVGTYHFAGSTDVVQSPASDILSARRQTELDDLVVRLAEWRPDQIAIEWPLAFSDSTAIRYRRYVAAGTTRSRNEVDQVAFRLARRLRHPTVYPIDHGMSVGNDSIGALLARRPDLHARREALVAALRARTDSIAKWRLGTSLVEHFREINSDASLSRGNSESMFGSWLPAGEGTNIGGPQLLARWYERNIIMVHNLTRVRKRDTRRILVLVGSGHVPAMRNILHESPDFCPVSPLPVLSDA